MAEVKEIQIEKIEVGKYEQRLDKEDNTIDDLAASIGRIGVRQPLLVIKKGDTFQLVAGHRRLLASVRVGLKSVPCILLDDAENISSEVAFAENFFRKDLSPIELAAAISGVFDSGDLTLEDLAKGFHRSEHWVRSMIAICDWPADVQQAIHSKNISVSAGNNLAMVTDDDYRAFLVRNAVEQGATARTTAAWLQAWRTMQPKEEAVVSEPVDGRPPPQPATPQAPCLACGEIFPVDRMSHVPMCGDCIKLIRQAGS